MQKIAIGLITYDEVTAKYLPYFFDSLDKQSFKNFDVFVFDNSNEKENSNYQFIKENYPQTKIYWEKENLGFAQGYNYLIDRVSEKGYKFFLVINPDIILKEEALEEMLKLISSDGDIKCVSPLIKVWDFENNKKTDVIDTCGIIMSKPLRFTDSFQGELDIGQYKNFDPLGASGACGLYRMSALEKIKDEFGYYDSRMFMYKEDCDLAYRMYLKKFKTKFCAKSVIYHDRTAKAEGTSILQKIKARKEKSKNVKEWSFVNQQLLFIKHMDTLSKEEKRSVILYRLVLLAYTYLFERYMIKEYKLLKTTLKK